MHTLPRGSIAALHALPRCAPQFKAPLKHRVALTGYYTMAQGRCGHCVRRLRLRCGAGDRRRAWTPHRPCVPAAGTMAHCAPLAGTPAADREEAATGAQPKAPQRPLAVDIDGVLRPRAVPTWVSSMQAVSRFTDHT